MSLNYKEQLKGANENLAVQKGLEIELQLLLLLPRLLFFMAVFLT